MSQLTQAQAEEYVKQANHQAYGDYRFGQALWNILPNQYTRKFVGTEADFFHTKDIDEALTIFYKHFVIGFGEI
tara:strand:- start:252 stop:473 length:222 start_codon:yes stop_codon:yes gene_type:complete